MFGHHVVGVAVVVVVVVVVAVVVVPIKILSSPVILEEDLFGKSTVAFCWKGALIFYA